MATQTLTVPQELRKADVAEKQRLQQDMLVTSSTIIAMLGLIWGLIYLYFGVPTAGAIPLAYAFLSFASIGYYAMTGRYHLFRFFQLLVTLIFPFLLMVVLGGFVNSSGVVLWSLTSPVGALLFAGRRQAAGWFTGFLGLIFLGGLIDAGVIPLPANWPAPIDTDLIITLFFLNIAGVSIVVFLLLTYFTRERDRNHDLLLVEQAKSEGLLLNVLPRSIADRLKNGEQTIADCHPEAGVLFADIVGFTPLSAELGVEQTVEVLNELLSRFDAISDKYDLEKIRTIGDGYMVASGVPAPRPDYAHALAEAALDMMAFVRSWNSPYADRIHVRIGINVGTIMAGVIGRSKFSYDVWGDPVNVASRMESTSLADCIQISKHTYELIKDDFITCPRGVVSIKGKGNMPTWFLLDRKERIDEPDSRAEVR
jgi:adenylate cyclase